MLASTSRFRRIAPAQMKGFTLVELLAVTVIIGILAALAVPSGINIWARIQLDDAQNKVERALRTARTNARASLLGRAWVVRVDNSEPNVPTLVIQDEQGLCDEPTPCQRVRLNNFVTVNSIFPDEVTSTLIAIPERSTLIAIPERSVEVMRSVEVEVIEKAPTFANGRPVFESDGRARQLDRFVVSSPDEVTSTLIAIPERSTLIAIPERSVEVMQSVEVEVIENAPTFANGGAVFESDGRARQLGRFVVSSTYSQGENRCVVVSTLIGTIRKDNDPACASRTDAED
ncbi:pilus assembly FimT family protein [Synechococcus sp. JA-2-3B'a(2-13)]|uniref:pilus assembly FimT family protein n=1 Tax=Synechococcus sp. (strain JA-2-3B'a(2-13)) TaxID=321332 RepID=UPI0000694E14|nr:prepilin-type N-terminal cleavage/methylation domain-containing protein [Synechococcus sp. JA-2-3B'a(2-13)]ABD02212.1 type IV pilin, putative [Synechococcus sp. JA-2-3B'a(2-13)]